jgi:protein phosphatase-4 regulatory subunit 3
VAALTILSHNETTSELSLQQHLDIAPDLVAYNNLPSEGDSEPSMMAQPVPHQATDKKRVKVYELRNNDWFDRGTGFCMATFSQVSLRVLPLSRAFSFMISRVPSHVAHQGRSCVTDLFFFPPQ